MSHNIFSDLNKLFLHKQPQILTKGEQNMFSYN